MLSTLIQLAVLAGGGALFLGLTIWRPVFGCALLALAIPLTTGLGRDTLIPLLRPNEALLLVVALGLMAHYIPRRRSLAISGLDVLVGTFVVGSVLIPALLLFVSHYDADLDRWQTVLGPVQFLMVYLVFSRTELSDRSLRLCLKLAMLASVIVGVVAIIQLTGVFPAFRNLVETYYPRTAVHAWEPLDRPTSLIGHFSSVGAFAVLNYSLALLIAAMRHPGFHGGWLSLVMGVNVASVLASLTLAPTIGLLPVTIAIIWYARRIPRQVLVVGIAGSLALVMLSPFLITRLEQQQIGSRPGQGLTIPQSLDGRLNLWQSFFFPALAQHIWLGTGTVIPSSVPETLNANVDNEYLGQAFRAGLVGVGLLILLLVGLGMAGWRCRESPTAWVRLLGGATLAYALLIAIIGISAEYLSYGGVAQPIAMVVGLLAGVARPPLRLAPAPAAASRAPRASLSLQVP
jgi:hypothetical protein